MTRDKFTPFLKLRKGRSKAGDAAAIWYIVHPAEDGIRKKWKPLPLRGPAAEPKARQVLAEFIRRREATVTLAGGGDDGGPMTVARWAPKWIESRVAKGNQAPEFYQSCLEHHIVPYLGHLRLDAVKPEHIEGLMAELARKGLAPKTRRNIYFAAHAMFQKAVPRLIAVNPCSLDEEDLPRRIDKDPEWRATAIFEPFEVEMLVYDHRIPFDRRVFYAISFLAGPRFGEVSALHHRHYLPELLPLGQLQVGLSYNSKKKKLGPTKGKKPRKVPVHPALKAILRQWLETGFREFMGRHWRPDDPLVPARWWKTRTIPTRPAPVVLRHRPYHTMWKRFQADLETLGLRPRRQHDDRRTFITMARAHGAQKDLLRLVTHGAEGDIIDVYSEIPWGALCTEVAKLSFGPGPQPPAGVVQLPAKGAELLDGGLPTGSQGGNSVEKQVDRLWAQQGSKTLTSLGQAPSSDGSGDHSAETLDLLPGTLAADAGTEPAAGAMATLATLALRQALDALDRGRLDELRSILELALEEERGGAVAGGRR